jgi:hypothetical protein
LLIDLGEMFLFPTEGPKYKLGMKGRLNELSATILQNIVVDMLAILINRAKEQGHTWSDGLSILQYADDTILFMDHNLDQAINMKLLLSMFEQLSGLQIHFHKSEVFCFGQAKEHESQYAQLFRSLPFK